MAPAVRTPLECRCPARLQSVADRNRVDRDSLLTYRHRLAGGKANEYDQHPAGGSGHGGNQRYRPRDHEALATRGLRVFICARTLDNVIATVRQLRSQGFEVDGLNGDVRVIGFTKALGNELTKTGVTVNAVCPGYVETPMAARVRQAYASTWGTTEEVVLAQFNDKIPLGRYSNRPCPPERDPSRQAVGSCLPLSVATSANDSGY